MKDSATPNSDLTSTSQSQPQPQPQPQSRWTPDSPHRALRMALASASLLSLAAVAGPIAAQAAGAAGGDAQGASTASTSGVYVTILSPNPGTSLAGVKQVEIRAYYESSFGVSGLDLFIDGTRMATQQLAKPEEKGEISFVVEASALKAGAHSIVVRATATDEEVSSARAEMSLPGAAAIAPEKASGSGEFDAESATGKSGAAAVNAVGAPKLGIVSPGPSSTVQGIVEIKVDASDASGKAPYVSLFVDHEFKTLRNYAPYTFDLDTNHLTNGKHTVEVWGYNDAQQVGHAKPLEIMVNNPGGHTFERRDLLDGPSAPAAHAHVTRGGAVISSHPPVAQARSVQLASASAPVAARRTLGTPSIAHTARKAMGAMIAKADRLASLGTGALLDSAGQDQASAPTLTAPAFAERGVSSDVFETRTFAAPTGSQSVAHTHSIVHKLQASQVPSLRPAHQMSAPMIASLNPRSMATLTAIAASSKLESASGGTALASGSLEDASGNAVAVPAPLAQPKVKIQLHAAPAKLAAASKFAHTAPVQIASSNLGTSSAEQKAAAEIAASARPQGGAKPQSAGKSVVKSVAETGAKQERKVALSVALADFRPHDVAALRGADQVMVNRSPVELSQPLQDRGAMLFAPMREIIERQGGSLDWDSVTRVVSATTANRSVKVTIGSRAASVNNQMVKLNSAPYLYNNRTMLPLDFFQKAMNATVSYDSATGHLLIQSK